MFPHPLCASVSLPVSTGGTELGDVLGSLLLPAHRQDLGEGEGVLGVLLAVPSPCDVPQSQLCPV